MTSQHTSQTADMMRCGDEDSLPLLEASGLGFSRDDEPIFEALSFALRNGDVLVVQGGNGSGKTTLLKVLAGLIEGTEGELLYLGKPLLDDLGTWLAEIALIGHQLGVKMDLSARDHLKWCRGVYGQRHGQNIDGVLRSVGLEGFEDIPTRRLSAGQRKRVALSRLLLCPAHCWLLDEPYANLDQEGLVLVNRLIDTHAQAGGIVILTSHGIYAPPRRQHITRILGQ